MTEGFRIGPQTSLKHVFIYRRKSVVDSPATELGFGGVFYFLPGKDLVCVESDVI